MARKDTEVFHLLEESLITVAAPSLVDEDQELSGDDLARYPFIQLATRPELWDDWFSNAGIERIDRLQGPRFQHFDMVISAAQAGMGIALIPEIFAQQAIASGTLLKVHSQTLSGPTPYVLIRPANREVSSALDAFTSWLRKAAR